MKVFIAAILFTFGTHPSLAMLRGNINNNRIGSDSEAATLLTTTHGLHGIAENVEQEEDSILVSHVDFGGISKINTITGNETEIVAANQDGRSALGIQTYGNAVLVAGGGQAFGSEKPAFYAYDLTSGNQLAACYPDTALFINDVVIVGSTAYFTCSKAALVIKVNANKLLGGICDFERILFPNEYSADFTIEDAASLEFAATGITKYNDGLVIANAATGGLYFFQPKTEATSMTKLTNIDTSLPVSIPQVQGVQVVNHELYATSNTSLHRFVISPNGSYIYPTETISSDDFNKLKSVVVYDGHLYVTDKKAGVHKINLQL